MRALIPSLKRYRVAAGALLGALLLTLFLGRLGGPVPFAFFLIAIVVSAWHGGLQPGLLATGFSTLLLLVLHTNYPAVLGSAAEGDYIPRLAVFLLIGLLASYLCKLCRRAVDAVDWIQATLFSITDAVVLTDSEGRITHLNGAAQDLCGWSLDEAVGQSVEAVFRLTDDPAQHATEPAILRALRADAVIRPAEALLTDRQGTAHVIEQTAAPIHDTDGTILGGILLCRDVGARRQADHHIRQNEEQFRTLADAAPIGVLLLDAAGRCVYSNACCQAVCGFTADESLGEGWARAVHPEDRNWVVTGWVSAARAMQPFACQFRTRSPEGEVRWLQLRAAPRSSDHGTPAGHVGTLEDVTTYKQAEEAMREGQGRWQRDAAERHRLEEALQVARQRQQELEANLAELTERNVALQAQLQEQETAHHETHRRATERTAELTRLHDDLKHQLDEHQHARQHLGRQLEEHRELHDSLRQQLSESHQHRTHLEQQLAAHQRAHHELHEQLAEHQLAREDLQRQLAEHQGKHGDLHRLLTEHQQARADLEKRLGEARQAHDELRRQLDEHRQGEPQRLERHIGERTEELLRTITALRERLQERERTWQEELERRTAELTQTVEALRAQLRDRGKTDQRVAELEEELTEQKKKGDDLQTAVQRLQALFENVPAALYLKDAEGHFLLANRAFRTLFHVNKKQIENRRDADLFPRDLAERFQAHDRQALSSQGPLPLEESLANERGPRTLLTLRAPVRDAAGKVTQLCGLAVDVTEQRGADEALRQEAARTHEEKHRTLTEREQTARADAEQARRRLCELVDGLDAAVCAVDTSGKVNFLNPAAQRLLGRDEKDAVGHDLRQFLPLPDDADAALRHARPARWEHAVATRKDGSFVPVAGTLTPLATGGAVITLREAVERKRTTPEVVSYRVKTADPEPRSVTVRPVRQAAAEEPHDWLAYN